MPRGEIHYRVIITQEVVHMLLYHSRFLAQVNPGAASRLLDEFRYKTKSLETFPERCALISDPLLTPVKYRKLLLAQRFLLIFHIKADTVFVDAFVDGRQEYTWLI